jgi:hypothetical protein
MKEVMRQVVLQWHYVHTKFLENLANVHVLRKSHRHYGFVRSL